MVRKVTTKVGNPVTSGCIYHQHIAGLRNLEIYFYASKYVKNDVFLRWHGPYHLTVSGSLIYMMGRFGPCGAGEWFGSEPLNT